MNTLQDRIRGSLIGGAIALAITPVLRKALHK